MLGRARVLVPRAIAYSGLLVALAVLGVLDAPPAALAAVAAGAGASLPPVGASVRTLLPALAPGDLRSTAFALEASLQEVYFVGGPLFVAALASVRPFAALVGAAAAAAVGTLALARVRPVHETEPPSIEEERTWVGALGAQGVRTVVALAVFLGVAFGAVEVAMPAFAEHHGSRALGGLALASFSGGSLVGGFVIGLRHGVDDRVRLLLFSAILPAGLALPLLAGSIPVMCLLVFLAGLPIAPLITGAYGLVDRIAPPGTFAETFAWIGTAISTGIALGAAVGGWIVDAHGVPSSIVGGVVAAVVGAAVLAARRASLGPRSQMLAQGTG
jgi:predicted MFS family arabinose efflux permease